MSAPAEPASSPRTGALRWLGGIAARWQLSRSSALILLALLAGLDVWADAARDRDFYLPDPFRILALASIAIFVVLGWVPDRGWRVGLRVSLVVLPVLGILGAERYLASRDAGIIALRIQIADDHLLRYHYRPGAGLRPEDAFKANSRGLLDVEHVIPKPPDTFRVVMLGDSVPNDSTIDFERRFPRLTEDALNAGVTGKRRVEVINVSCEGYNTIQEVRLLETVGLAYEPDLVVVAYVLNDPFLQNGGYRRVGNSYFMFNISAATEKTLSGTSCNIFAPLHQGYGFDLVVRSSFQRLALLAKIHRFDVVVAPLPIVEAFDDHLCRAMYDQVGQAATEQGFGLAEIVEAFQGRDYRDFLKPNDRSDVTHPNAAGHALIAQTLAHALRPRIDRATTQRQP